MDSTSATVQKISVGDLILIYWDGDRKWYPGEVVGVNADSNCEVLYEDGERETVNLNEVKFMMRKNWKNSIRERKVKCDEKDRIQSIKNNLFDIVDRLPLAGVYEKNLEWWKHWHDGVLLDVKNHNVRGIMRATLDILLQLKPKVMSTWWATNNTKWKKRLETASTIFDAELVVKELQSKAFNWSHARHLFSPEMEESAKVSEEMVDTFNVLEGEGSLGMSRGKGNTQQSVEFPGISVGLESTMPHTGTQNVLQMSLEAHVEDNKNNTTKFTISSGDCESRHVNMDEEFSSLQEHTTSNVGRADPAHSDAGSVIVEQKRIGGFNQKRKFVCRDDLHTLRSCNVPSRDSKNQDILKKQLECRNSVHSENVVMLVRRRSKRCQDLALKKHQSGPHSIAMGGISGEKWSKALSPSCTRETEVSNVLISNPQTASDSGQPCEASDKDCSTDGRLAQKMRKRRRSVRLRSLNVRQFRVSSTLVRTKDGVPKLVNPGWRKSGTRSCILPGAEYSRRITSESDPSSNGCDSQVAHEGSYSNEMCDGAVGGVDLHASFDVPFCSICQTEVAGNLLLRCDGLSCFLSFHTFCMYPPLHIVPAGNWLCPCCKDSSALHGKIKHARNLEPKKIQGIIGRRQIIVDQVEKILQYQYLIKWKSLSHHHDTWVPVEWVSLFDRARLRGFENNFHSRGDPSDVIDKRNPEWLKIDRVIACRTRFNVDKSHETGNFSQACTHCREHEFLVKWIGLDYSDATWETNCTEELLAEAGRLVQRHQRANERSGLHYGKSHFPPLNEQPSYLNGVLYDYQMRGLNWMMSNYLSRKNVILADEMGLGKTVQVVSFASCLKHENLSNNPVLIIAPKSILFHWEKEFRCWAEDLNVVVYQGERVSRKCIQTHELYSSQRGVLFDVLITNYELVLLDNNVLRKFNWSAIIIDEAHKIKNHACKLASYLKHYTADFRLLLTAVQYCRVLHESRHPGIFSRFWEKLPSELTLLLCAEGTPLQNTLLELFSLLHFLDPEEFSNPLEDAKSFSNIGRGFDVGDMSSSDMQISQIHDFLRPRMLRRMKADVLPRIIPIKKWVEVPCALTSSQRELYVNLLMKNYKELNKGIHSGKKIVLNFLLVQLKKCCNHPYLFPGQESYISSREESFRSLVEASGKLQLLEKLLPKLRERGNRVLLFSQMTKMLDILEDFLAFLGLPYFRIDGKTATSVRQQQIQEFNNPKSRAFIFLISTRSGGLGLDLPGANRVIIYDPDFNPFCDLQAQSRAHRIGQLQPVVVYQLISKCSVEEKILQKSKRKLAIEHLVMNPTQKLNVEDLQSVLLHGARKILSKESLAATSIFYDDNAVEALLKLDPSPDEKCAPEENGYLGSIESFIPNSENEEENPMPRANEWQEILRPIEEMAAGELGRGKRQREAVKYFVENQSDSDASYAPESDSINNSSDGSSTPDSDNNSKSDSE